MAEMTAKSKSKAETMGFQTEAKQLLQLMIHSLYSNKEIFLRELISNASDATDKLRVEALENSALYESDGELRIRIAVNEEAKTIEISDNGIGMSKDEVIANLGTIAKSGTSEFLKNLTGDQKKDSQLIGQFGVGFYSSFIVAKQVVVETRRAGAAANEAVRWTSEGEADFKVESIEKADRGTSITLILKDDEQEFANNWRLRSIIKKYSDHIYTGADGKNSDVDVLTNRAVSKMKDLGAEIIEVDQIFLNDDIDYNAFQVMLHEYKDGLNDYFASLGPDAAIKNLTELIEFNINDKVEMDFYGQEYLEMAVVMEGMESEDYFKHLEAANLGSRVNGIDRVMDAFNLDAIMAPSGSPAWKTDHANGDKFTLGSSSPAAISGYPSITVPMGYVDELPVGLSIFGRQWSEGELIDIAYLYEQATKHRREPKYIEK